MIPRTRASGLRRFVALVAPAVWVGAVSVQPARGGPPLDEPGSGAAAVTATRQLESRPARSRAEALMDLVRAVRAFRQAVGGEAGGGELVERKAAEVRGALRSSRDELSSLRQRAVQLQRTIADAEARERRLVARLEALLVARELVRRRLPPDEVLAELPTEAGPAPAPPRSFTPEESARSRALFSGDVAALLESSCARCHGEKRQRGKLSLASRQGALQGGSRGPAIVPGAPQRSLLWKLVRRDSEPFMPPREPLSAAEVEVLREWIETGASWGRADAGERHPRLRRF